MLTIYTDGACYPNPGPGGWGFTRSDGVEHFGGSDETTNNRMELTGILEALKGLPKEAQAVIYSDSRYCVDGATGWRFGWARKGWQRKHKGTMVPVMNADLWKAIAEELDSRPGVKIKWVRGHNGTAGNERADRLAYLGWMESNASAFQYNEAFKEVMESVA